MDVREKLVEIIQNSVGGCARHWAEVIADGLIAHGVTVQEWISVDDRLPEDSGYYLAVYQDKYSGSISTAFEMYIKCKIGEWWANEYTRNITHWMPVPELPKG